MQPDSVLVGPPVGSIVDLLERMAALDAALPASDGLACFNRMYRLVTLAVQQHLDSGSFAEPAWMANLDVVFANLYLDAARASVTQPAQVPRAWAAFLERRADTRVVPLQFALAGLSAHINRDLPVAVVLTCDALATSPDTGAHYADYERVNGVLASVEPQIREAFADDFLDAPDQAVPGLEDLIANFNILKARETAWASARTLWELRQRSPALEASFLDGLDHLVGFAGRGLLVPLRAAPTTVNL